MYFLDLWGCLCCFRILHVFFEGRYFVTKERCPIQWSYCITPISRAFSPQEKTQCIIDHEFNRTLIEVIYFTFLDPPGILLFPFLFVSLHYQVSEGNLYTHPIHLRMKSRIEVENNGVSDIDEINYQVIQAVTFLSPNVGAHLIFEGVTNHHPKKVTKNCQVMVN